MLGATRSIFSSHAASSATCVTTAAVENSYPPVGGYEPADLPRPSRTRSFLPTPPSCLSVKMVASQLWCHVSPRGSVAAVRLLAARTGWCAMGAREPIGVVTFRLYVRP